MFRKKITLLFAFLIFSVVVTIIISMIGYVPKTRGELIIFSAIQAPVGLFRDITTKFKVNNLQNSQSDIVFPSEIYVINCEDTAHYLTNPELLKESKLQPYIEKLGKNTFEDLMLCETDSGTLLFKYGTKNFGFGTFNDLYVVENNNLKKLLSLGGYVDLYNDKQKNIYFKVRVSTKDILYEFTGSEIKKIKKYSTNNVDVICPTEEDLKNRCTTINLYSEFENQNDE